MLTSRAVAIALVLSATAARAETKAWSKGKSVIASGAVTVGGVNAATARSSQLYQQLVPMVLAQAGPAQSQLDGIKKDCGIDVLDVVDSIAVGLDADQHGAIVIAIKGTTRKELEACAQKRATAAKQAFTIKTEGAYSVYTNPDGGNIYVKWLAPDVVALSTSADDKAASDKLLAGGLLNDKTLKTRIAAINTDAAVWGVIAKTQELQPGQTMNGAYGSINLAKGNVDVNLHVVMANAAGATAFVTDATKQIDDAKKGGLPPALGDALKTLKLKAAGAEVLATVSFAEKSVFELIGAAMGGAVAH